MDERLRRAVEESAELHGAHLIDCVLRGTQGRAVIEVFVDTENGVTTDLCALVSRELSRRIEAEELLPGSYRLEVSSPGIERPLKFFWQYTKHLGRPARIQRKTAGGSEEVRGRLASLEGNCVSLEVPGGGPVLSIPFDAIIETRIEMPW